jgi:lipopolysaccharide export system permease protein
MIGQTIDRYVVRTTLGAFVVTLLSLTLLVWITQALRQFDLITGKGQTLVVFLSITSMLLPFMMQLIAPIALAVAFSWVLNKLNSDSEIVVLSSAGLSSWRVARPFLLVAVLVSLLVALFAWYVTPAALRSLRIDLTQVRADVLANIVQPGRFITLESGITFHIKERRTNGLLEGIFLHDTRDPQQTVTYLAERGQIAENERGMFLVLDRGSVQRRTPQARDPDIVTFDRYAFDLSQFSGDNTATVFTQRERPTSELFAPDVNDAYYKSRPGRFRSELHDRLVSPLYPLTFAAIAFAFLGQPRTTRQGRAFAMTAAALWIAGLRIAGFALTTQASRSPGVVPLIYLVPFASLAGALWLIRRGIVIEEPAWLTALNANLKERFDRFRLLLATRFQGAAP